MSKTVIGYFPPFRLWSFCTPTTWLSIIPSLRTRTSTSGPTSGPTPTTPSYLTCTIGQRLYHTHQKCNNFASGRIPQVAPEFCREPLLRAVSRSEGSQLTCSVFPLNFHCNHSSRFSARGFRRAATTWIPHR